MNMLINIGVEWYELLGFWIEMCNMYGMGCILVFLIVVEFVKG